MTKITVTLKKLYVADHGDPNNEPKGELYYQFKADHHVLANVSQGSPLKVHDGQTINLNKSRTFEKDANGSISLSGFVAERDPFDKDECDTFKVILRKRNKWLKGRRKVTLCDGPLRVVLHYEVEVEGVSSPATGSGSGSESGSSNPIRPSRCASLTIVSFEDSEIFNLFQNAHNAYGNCFEGYDKSILFKLSYSAPRRPDVLIREVTKSRIFDTLRELADDGYFIDIFIFSHGTRERFVMKDGETIRGRDLDQLATGRYANGKFPIRMVYQMNCNGSSLNNDFLRIGAKVVCGSRTINFYPNQFNKFARTWNRGERFDLAVHNSNTASSRTAMQVLVVAESKGTSFQPKCKGFKTVLSKSPCSKAFFTQKYLGRDFHDTLSGKENMNYASKMIISGDVQLRKSDIETW